MSECLQNDRVVLIVCQQVAASVIYKNPLIVPFVQRVSIFILYSSAHSSLAFNYEFSRNLSFNAKSSFSTRPLTRGQKVPMIFPVFC